MSSSSFLASLNLGTLLIALFVIVAALGMFLRRRSNRRSMDGRQERNIAKDLDTGRVAPDHSPRA